MRIPLGLRAAAGAVSGWDLDNAAYSGTDFDVSSQIGLVSGLAAGDNGTKLYVIDASSTTGRAAHQYDLSTAWDISTASYANKSLSLASQNPSSPFFKPDGTKFYAPIDTLSTTNAIHEYTLSTAWDISTASYNASSPNFFATDNNLRGIYIRDNGTDLYWAGFENDKVYQFSMSTAWDITTLSYVQSFSVLTQDAIPLGVSFKPNGTRMFITGNTNDKVYQYELSTAWDVTTASFSKDFSVTSQNTSPSNVVFNPTGKIMILSGNTPRSLYSYTL